MMFNLYNTKGQTDLPKIELNQKLHSPELYLPSDGLMSAVNVALNLSMPLLLTGEPGTGKTELAHHVAWHFKLGKALVFNAQTTSSAKDLFYRYDALGHFQYSQTQKEVLDSQKMEERFIRFQALGEAIRENVKTVVLLDEIDKAPRDLPNDVLAALENLQFEVAETGLTYKADSDNRPFIIMTSNSEKNLPDAFLRRVVYYHIPFPDHASLLKIVSAKVENFEEGELETLIDHFEAIRSDRKARLRKKPATAELIQWAALLKRMRFPVNKLAAVDELNEVEEAQLHASYSVLAKSKEDLKTLIEW